MILFELNNVSLYVHWTGTSFFASEYTELMIGSWTDCTKLIQINESDCYEKIKSVERCYLAYHAIIEFIIITIGWRSKSIVAVDK